MATWNKAVFSANLQYYLTASNKTQKEVADAIGVTPAAFSEWIQGHKYPRIDKIERLAQYFHCQKSDLIESKDSRSNKMSRLAEMLGDNQIALLNGAEDLTDEQMQDVLKYIQFIKTIK